MAYVFLFNEFYDSTAFDDFLKNVDGDETDDHY